MAFRRILTAVSLAGLCFTAYSREMIGRIDSKGQIVDENGRRIGTVDPSGRPVMKAGRYGNGTSGSKGGYAIKKQASEPSAPEAPQKMPLPQETSVSEHGNSVIMTNTGSPSPMPAAMTGQSSTFVRTACADKGDGEECLDDKKGICITPGIDGGPFDTIGTAAESLKSKCKGKGGQCDVKLEASWSIFEKDGKYYTGLKTRYCDDAGTAKHSAPILILPEEDRQNTKVENYKLVARLHNHPDQPVKITEEMKTIMTKDEVELLEQATMVDWPSATDAKNAKHYCMDSFVYGCTTGKLLWLHASDGHVTEVVNGREIAVAPPKTLIERKYVFDNGTSITINYEKGHEVYDPDKWNEFSSENVEGMPECRGVKGEAGQTGVRGWCHCWNAKPPPYGVLILVGEMNFLEEGVGLFELEYGFKQVSDGAYAYRICSHCGKCDVTVKKGDDWNRGGALDIDDAGVYNKWHDKAGSEIPLHEFCKMMAAARDKLLDIPDGKIVIPGECNCKYPDPVKVGLMTKESFYVCCFCGRVRQPDENGSIPCGPTHWQHIMPDKPFPGFGK